MPTEGPFESDKSSRSSGSSKEPAAQLRDGMAAVARPVTGSPGLPDRIIDAAMSGGSTTGQVAGRAWRRWLVPVASAVGVLVLIGAALLATNLLGSDSDNKGSAPAVATSSAAPTSSPSNTASTTAPSSTAASTAATTALQPAGGPVPAGFRTVDLTWISADLGWALGTAPCAHAPCTSIARTADGGKTWVGLPAPAAELSSEAACQGQCVGSIRFANSQVGYAFGPTALFMTTDGGASWSKQPGQADGLEIANGTVLRVTSSSQGGCPPGCVYKLQKSAVGSTDWQDVSLPTVPASVGAQLVRSGSNAALLFTAHIAGGAQTATSTLLVSTNNGANWTNRREVCPQSGQAPLTEVDSRQVAMAPDGSVSVLCVPRTSTGAASVMTATDPAGSFSRTGGLSAKTTAVGAASSGTLFAVSDAVYRSVGQASWSRSLADPSLGGSGLAAPYLGFENATTGRYISGDGRTVWTTTDAGGHWTPHVFG